MGFIFFQPDRLSNRGITFHFIGEPPMSIDLPDVCALRLEPQITRSAACAASSRSSGFRPRQLLVGEVSTELNSRSR